MWEDAGSQTCGWRRKRKMVKERCGRGGEGGGGGKRKLFQQRNKPPAYSINCLSSNQDLSHLSTFVPEKGCLGLSLSRGWETGWWWYFKQVECVCARWDTERRYRYSHKKGKSFSFNHHNHRTVSVSAADTKRTKWKHFTNIGDD